MGEQRSFDENASVNLLTTFSELRQQVYAAYPADTLHLLNESSTSPEALPERWWEVQEYTFTSTVPLMGPVITGFRRLWHSLSTKWAIRFILQQQNRVNYGLLERLEVQTQILRDIDHEQTRLITQVAELEYRLQKLEARLVALEQQR